jgi:hypothetical protein
MGRRAWRPKHSWNRKKQRAKDLQVLVFRFANSFAVAPMPDADQRNASDAGVGGLQASEGLSVFCGLSDCSVLRG